MNRCDSQPTVEAITRFSQLLWDAHDAYPVDDAGTAAMLAVTIREALQADPTGAPAALAAAFRNVVAATLAAPRGGQIRARAIVTLFGRALALVEERRDAEAPDAPP